jgi:hypothetical protein
VSSKQKLQKMLLSERMLERICCQDALVEEVGVGYGAKGRGFEFEIKSERSVTAARLFEEAPSLSGGRRL